MAKNREKAIQTVKPSKLLHGATRHIQGIGSTPDDVTLLGEKLRLRVGDAIVGEGMTLTRSIEAASTLEVPVHDPDGELRTSRLLEAHYVLNLDGLEFVFVGMRREGDLLTLTHEARPAFRLRQRKGAAKVYRGTWTRAEFLALLVDEVRGPRIPFFSPALHKKQRIAKGEGGEIKTEQQGRDAEAEVGPTKGKGLDMGANLTVKGARANSEQLRNGDRVLRVGASLDAPPAAQASVIVTGIQENSMLNSSGGDQTSDGYFQVIDGTAANLGIDPLNLEECAHVYFTKGFYIHGGAIANAKRGLSPAEISSAVEGNAAGASDRIQWEKEAGEWVEAFEGGDLGGGGPASDTVETTKRYAFERGKNESTWAAGVRLAEEVRWRWFEAAGVVYYVAEPHLLESKIRMRVSEHADGVDAISYDWDVGRKTTEVSVTARARAWAAPPGTVAVISGEGPADGRYIVSSITSHLSDDGVEVTLRRPVRPLPEPAPETETKTVGGTAERETSAGGGEGGEAMVRWCQSQVGTQEGSAEQQRYASALGFSASLPWCSIFVGYGLKQVDGPGLPGNPAYSGAWLEWSGGEKVSASSIAPGDLTIFDWGDGGMTDHVAVYVGGGQVIGGNQSNAVTKVSWDRGATVGVVRPKY